MINGHNGLFFLFSFLLRLSRVILKRGSEYVSDPGLLRSRRPLPGRGWLTMVKKFMKVTAMRLAALLPDGKISEEVCTLCVEMVHQSKHTKSMDTRADPPGHHLLQAK